MGEHSKAKATLGWRPPRRKAGRAMVAIFLLGCGGAAFAETRTLVVGAGDCNDGFLLDSVRRFTEVSRGLLGRELLDHDEVLGRLRPQPTRGLDDLQRQIETARSLFFNGQNERALELLKDALAGLDRASPQVDAWPSTVSALMLSAQLYKNIDRNKSSNEAFGRILRVEPDYRADPDTWPPSTIRALEAVRREVRHSKKGLLRVTSLSGPGVSVFVDGREAGKTPLRLELPQGAYRLSLVSGAMVSFPRMVNLGRDESVQVDMAFEGSLAARSPLCLTGEDAGALKLASAVGASRVVVLRNAAQKGNPPYLSGVLYEVDLGERVRNGGIRPAHLRDLMTYLFTGQPDISKEPSPSAEPVALQERPLLEAARLAPRAFPLRPFGFGALGVGAAAAIAGVVVFALAPPIRKDGNGYIIPEDVPNFRDTQVRQGVGVGLMVGGALVAAAGGAALILAQRHVGTVETAIVPTWGGALVVVGGKF